MTQAIDLVLPAHNEGGSIGQTLDEFYRVATVEGGLPVRFIVCEDGSKDNTVEVIKEAMQRLPIVLISGSARKGYSRAVIDGMRAATGSLVGFIDSDGQCDPRDFKSLYDELTKSGCDLVVGYRNPRRDHWIRLVMSGLFNQVYKLYFKVGLRDPSCPYLIIRKEALVRVLDGDIGTLNQGFWWEFYARARARQLTIRQVPVSHRARTSGRTVVYRPARIPEIAWSHIRGLARLRRELAAIEKT